MCGRSAPACANSTESPECTSRRCGSVRAQFGIASTTSCSNSQCCPSRQFFQQETWGSDHKEDRRLPWWQTPEDKTSRGRHSEFFPRILAAYDAHDVWTRLAGWILLWFGVRVENPNVEERLLAPCPEPSSSDVCSSLLRSVRSAWAENFPFKWHKLWLQGNIVAHLSK